MRIAQVAPLYERVPPVLYGGTERVVSYLTEQLVRLGHDVTLFATRDSLTSARLVAACPRSLRLDAAVVDPLAHHMIQLDQVARQASRFDIIHFHTDYVHFPVSRLAGWPHVTTLHGRLDIRDLQLVYRTFSEEPLVSISENQREPVPFANWQGTVYHGLPADRYRCRGGGDYLAFVGRVSREKRLDRAIAIAVAAGRRLRIAAKIDPVDESYFNAQIKPLLEQPGIEFVGEIGEHEKEEFIGNAAALLFPIDWCEPFGLVMIEAMACGTPVIAWRCGSVPEVIADGISGFIVDSLESAVAAVGRLDAINRRRCRQEFEARFTVERMAADYLAIYEQLAPVRAEAGMRPWPPLSPASPEAGP